MSRQSFAVGRGVTAEMIRLAALEVPGVMRVGRGGSAIRKLFGGSPIVVRIHHDRVHVRIWVVARPGQELPPLFASVRAAVGGAVERLLGLELGAVTVVVDGIGG